MSNSYGTYLVHKQGEPEAMQWQQAPLRTVAPNEVRIRNEAIGVDFIDTMIRSGQLPAQLPTGIGFAGVGIVQETGEQVSGLAIGDRVAYMYFVAGSYAEQRYVPADRVFKLPNQEMPAVVAAGALFRGLTAWYLVKRMAALKPGDTALVHAAAGGVGLILVQWLKHLGVKVVGTVSRESKVATLKDYGCDHAVVIPDQDFAAKVMDVSEGKGAAVVYDCIGKATLEKSMECTRRFGLIVSFGWPSGDLDNLSLMNLRSKGSLFITRPTVTHYTADAEDLQQGCTELFQMVEDGHLRINTQHTYPLSHAAQAHRDMAEGKTVGSVVLTV